MCECASVQMKWVMIFFLEKNNSKAVFFLETRRAMPKRENSLASLLASTSFVLERLVRNWFEKVLTCVLQKQINLLM